MLGTHNCLRLQLGENALESHCGLQCPYHAKDVYLQTILQTSSDYSSYINPKKDRSWKIQV